MTANKQASPPKSRRNAAVEAKSPTRTAPGELDILDDTTRFRGTKAAAVAKTKQGKEGAVVPPAKCDKELTVPTKQELQPLANEALLIIVKQLCESVIAGQTTARNINGTMLSILDRAASGVFRSGGKLSRGDKTGDTGTQLETLLSDARAKQGAEPEPKIDYRCAGALPNATGAGGRAG